MFCLYSFCLKANGGSHIQAVRNPFTHFQQTFFVVRLDIYFLCHRFCLFRGNNSFLFLSPFVLNDLGENSYDLSSLFLKSQPLLLLPIRTGRWKNSHNTSSASSVLTTDGQRCMQYSREHPTRNLYSSIFNYQHMQKKCLTKSEGIPLWEEDLVISSNTKSTRTQNRCISFYSNKGQKLVCE